MEPAGASTDVESEERDRGVHRRRRQLPLRDPLVSCAQRMQYRGTSLIRNCFLLGPYMGLCLGSYGGPGGVEVSYEQGTPVRNSMFGDHVSAPASWAEEQTPFQEVCTLAPAC